MKQDQENVFTGHKRSIVATETLETDDVWWCRAVEEEVKYQRESAQSYEPGSDHLRPR